MDFILPLIYLLVANAFFVIIFKNSFGKCLPLTLMTTAFTYFLSQTFFGTFKIGLIINILFAISFICILLYYIFKRKSIEFFKELYFSKGFYSFCLIYICIYFFNFNRTFTQWDEFSHWGVMVKEMFRLDKFYSIDASTLMVHKDYPPIIQLFEMFFAQISGGYKETYLLRAVHLFSFSLFIPSICDVEKNFSKVKVIIKSFFMLGSGFLILLFFDQHGIINTIYTDYIIAILVAYLLAVILFEKNTLSTFNLIRLSIGCAFLVLTKQIALVLYLMILFMFIVDILLKNKFKVKKILNKKNIITALGVTLLIIVIPMLCWLGWNMYVEQLNAEQQFKFSDLKISEVNNIIVGISGEQYQQQAANNFISALKTCSMTTSTISLSYFQCMALVLILLVILWWFSGDLFCKEKISILGITLSIGSIGYAFVMLVTYIFSFGEREGPALASFNRYMPTYILICMTLLLMIFTYIDNHKDKKTISIKFYSILFVVLFIIQSPSQTVKCIPKLSMNTENYFEILANDIISNTEENSSVYIIAQNTDSYYQFFIKYFMDSYNVNLINYNLPIEDDENYDYYGYFNNEIKNYMLEYDFLYLANIDENFIKNYSFMFDDITTVKNLSLYKINKDNGNLALEFIK